MCPYEKRFWTYVEKTDTCWLWQRGLSKGYGQFWDGKKNRKAHRYAYELKYGPVSARFHMDHLCRNPACVNPDHLEAVTPRENSMRGFGAAALNYQKTHCAKGHPFQGANLKIESTGERICLICAKKNWSKKNKKIAERRWKAREKDGLLHYHSKGTPYTHCLRGHEANSKNSRIYKGVHFCRVCHRLRESEYRQKDRVARGLPASAKRVNAETHCKNGHQWTSENTYWQKNGVRYCRTCGRDGARARRLRGKAN